MNYSELPKLFDGESVAVFSRDDFVKRAHNSFDSGIKNVIYGVKEDDREVIDKINDYFGNAKTEYNDGCLIVYPDDLFNKDRYTFGDLIEIIYRLRDPDGCPWDRAQTNKSIRNNIIEESYELVEAVDLDDTAKMREESGDVVLQGIFTAVIADADNRFSVNDVISELCRKLVGRHTHIFGPDKATDPESALYFWEKAKYKEKKYESLEDKLDSVPATFNAVMKANKVQKIIKKTGFDFADIDGAIEKLYEEIEEFIKAPEDKKESEAGDIMFAAINVLRMAHIDPEVALNATTDRFRRRFSYVIKCAEDKGKKVEELSIDEMERYYQEAKKFEK